MGIRSIDWEDIKIGEEAMFSRVIDKETVGSFIAISGDINPIHSDEEFSSKTVFKQPIAPGMLLASLFSALVGVYLPGRDSLYLSQTLNFKNPVFVGDEVVVWGRVVKKVESLGVMYIKTEIKRGKQVLVEGEAAVKHLNYEKRK